MAEQKRAVQRLIQSADGTLAIVYIDLATQQPIHPSQMAGYRIINSSNPQVELVQSFDNPNEVQAVHNQQTGQTTHVADLTKYAGGRQSDNVVDRRNPTIGQAFKDGFENMGHNISKGWETHDTAHNPIGDRQIATMEKGPAGWAKDTTLDKADFAHSQQYKGIADFGSEVAKAPVSPPSVSDTPMRGTIDPGTGNRAGFMSNFGPNRPNMPTGDIAGKVQMAVGEVMGPGYTVVGTSGMEDPGHQYGSNRHKTGKAMDFHIEGPDGKRVTDKKALKDIGLAASELGVQGIGFGSEYMGDSTMHFDTVSPDNYKPGQDSGWGSIGNEWQGDMDAQRNAPISGPNQTWSGVPTVRPSTADSVISSVSNPNQDVVTKDVSNMSAGEMLGMGIGDFAERSPAEKEAIGRALAGEASKKTLDGLASGDPSAMVEFDNMMSSVENRAASSKYPGGLKDVLTGSQYNSLMDAKLGTTNSNFASYRDPVMNAVNNFYGASVATQPGATNYYNPKISNPDWGTKMKDPTVAGEHKFGILDSPYDNPSGSAFNEMRDRMATDQRNDPSNFTGVRDYTGKDSKSGSYSYGGRQDTPSEGGSRFGGSGLGGGYSGKDTSDNSPTEGSRFGGSNTGSTPTHTTEHERDTSLGGSGLGGYSNKGTEGASKRSGGLW